MRFLFSFFWLLALSATACAQEPGAYQTDFSNLSAETFAREWEISGTDWRLTKKNGAQVLAADVPHRLGTALWQPIPNLWLRAGVWESTLTPLRAHGAKGKRQTVGIGLWLDERNFWQLSLVAASAKSKAAPKVELAQMRDGQWNAQNAEKTKRPVLETSPPFDWRYGETYRLRLSAQGSPYGGARNLLGEVWQGKKRVWHRVYALEAVERGDIMSVNIGRPVLLASGMSAHFSRAVLRDVQFAVAP